MPRTELADSAQNISQIVPLSERKPRKQHKPKHLVSPKLTTGEKLLEAQIEIDRIQRDLEITLGERDIAREETKAAKRQLVDICQFKDRCLSDNIEWLETGLNHGIWTDNRIQLRRRVSRNKGARDYKGFGDYPDGDNSK